MATSLAIAGTQKTLKHQLGPIGKARWTKIQSESGEVRQQLLKSVTQATQEPFPLGPFRFHCLQKGWVKMYLQPNHGFQLRAEKGFELHLNVPKKEFHKVTLEQEVWNDEAKDMMNMEGENSQIYLKGQLHFACVPNTAVYVVVPNTLCAQYTLCPFHFVPIAFRAHYILCPLHFVPNACCAQCFLCAHTQAHKSKISL